MSSNVSIIIVSDYGSGDDKGWDDLRETLKALASQDYAGPAEYLLLESAAFEPSLPDDLRQLLPGLKVVFCEVDSSYALKNKGAEIAEGDLLGVLDGDCAPAPGWISHMVAAFEAHPEAAVVSGRTMYRSPSVTERIIGLLSRAYLDTGAAGPTNAIANNNAAFRREALLAHPFLDDIGAFGGKLQAESMRRAGLKFHFEPGMLAVHAYEGWGMERDIRSNTGYATVMVRRIDPRISLSWLAKIGWLGIPLFYLARLLLSWGSLLRLHDAYDVPWSAVPKGMALAAYLHWLEIPGLKLALAGGRIERTAYR
jgi:cellulose synthase/poly-beta-1,6-N-acetylglucosamine synthase-like glycosyltransferase